MMSFFIYKYFSVEKGIDAYIIHQIFRTKLDLILIGVCTLVKSLFLNGKNSASIDQGSKINQTCTTLQ